MRPCSPKEDQNCGCLNSKGENKSGQQTDLIVLIDTSGSMGASAKAVSDAVTAAIAKAKKNCKPDLKLTFLGVDGTWASTTFNQSHRNYITGIHGTVPLAADINHVGLKQEQGANAIQDLSKYAQWRKGACRAIFYISDEELDSVSPQNDFANETAATNAAITEANLNKVTVFTHHLTYQNRAPQIIQNYKDLCDNTGGKSFFSNAPKEKEYVELLSEIICNSCGIGKPACKEIEFPELKPCISISWGDSDCDCFESSDMEVMTLTICNCYSNVKFLDVNAATIEVVDENGNPVPILPDGRPSIQVYPMGPFCFGDIEPCSCITREFVLLTANTKPGKYKLSVKGLCFNVQHSIVQESQCFELDICKD